MDPPATLDFQPGSAGDSSPALETQGSAMYLDAQYPSPFPVQPPRSPPDVGEAWAAAVATASEGTDQAILSVSPPPPSIDGVVSLISTSNGIPVSNGTPGVDASCLGPSTSLEAIQDLSAGQLQASGSLTSQEATLGSGANGCSPAASSRWTSSGLVMGAGTQKPSSSKPAKGGSSKSKGKKKGPQLMTDYQPIDDRMLCNVCMDIHEYEHNAFLQCNRWVVVSAWGAAGRLVGWLTGWLTG